MYIYYHSSNCYHYSNSLFFLPCCSCYIHILLYVAFVSLLPKWQLMNHACVYEPVVKLDMEDALGTGHLNCPLKKERSLT